MASLSQSVLDELCESRDFYIYCGFVIYIAYIIPFVIGIFFSEIGQMQMNREIANYQNQVPINYNQSVSQILGMVILSLLQYVAHIHYILKSDFLNNTIKVFTILALFVPGCFYTCICFITNRTNIFSNRKEIKTNLVVPVPNKKSLVNQNPLYKQQQQARTQSQTPKQQIIIADIEEEETGCDTCMHFLVQTFFFFATLIATQFLFLLKFPAIYVYTPNPKKNFGRNFQRKFGVNTLFFTKTITYDLLLIILILANCKTMTCIGVITLAITFFQFFYYSYPYVLVYQCYQTSFLTLMLTDHPKFFPERNLIDMQRKFLQLQQANMILAKKCDKQEEIKLMITQFEQEQVKTNNLITEQQKQIEQLTYQNIFLTKNSKLKTGMILQNQSPPKKSEDNSEQIYVPVVDKVNTKTELSQNDISNDNLDQSATQIFPDKNAQNTQNSSQIDQNAKWDPLSGSHIPYGMQQRLLYEMGKLNKTQDVPTNENQNPQELQDFILPAFKKEYMSFRKEQDIPKSKREIVVPQNEKNRILMQQADQFRLSLQNYNDEEN